MATGMKIPGMDLTFNRSLQAAYGVVTPLSPRVARLLAPNPGPYTFRGTGVHLVCAGGRVAVIDPGPDSPAHLEALKSAIGTRRVSHILVTHTHRDHSPAAAALKAWSGASTYGFGPHGPDGGAVEEGADRAFVPDVTVRDGDVITGDGVTMDCVFTPGHTANHMCYALREERALFCGDHVMGWSTSVIAPPDGNMGDYLASLERLIARDDAILYPAHGSPITDPQGWLRALLAHRQQRQAQVAAAVAAGLVTAEAIAARLYPGLDPALRGAAAAQVQAHLDHLRAIRSAS